jgi:predicted nucleic acid-binding protein
MTYLFDTNVICELRKRHPDARVLGWYETVASAEIFISALAIGEIRLGIERLRRKDSTRADLLEQWLRGLRPPAADLTGRRASPMPGVPERSHRMPGLG